MTNKLSHDHELNKDFLKNRFKTQEKKQIVLFLEKFSAARKAISLFCQNKKKGPKLV